MSGTNSQWLMYAIASGGCAALNGVFAKLTTTQLTTTWASTISNTLGMEESSAAFEVLVRVVFFSLNLAFNGVMWGLFTRALTLSSSTVRVSVINTSANFVVTALLGAVIFREELTALWWLGAGLLVAGSVIIGRREEGSDISAAEKAGDANVEVAMEGTAHIFSPAKGSASGADGGLENSAESRRTSPRKKGNADGKAKQ